MTIFTVILLLVVYLSFLWAFQFYFKKEGSFKKGSVLAIAVIGILIMAVSLGGVILRGASTGSSVWGGVVLLVTSVLLFWSVILSHKSNPPLLAFSDKTAEKLNVAGPYRYIRHPFYTSYTLAWFGGTLVSGIWLLFIATFAIFYLYYVAAKNEEQQFLNSSMAESYQNYRKETGMFFPFI